MAINSNIEDLGAKFLKLAKSDMPKEGEPGFEESQKLLQVFTLGIHVAANLLIDIKRIADALEKIANGIESIDRS